MARNRLRAFWTITWTPGDFREGGTDVHTLAGVPSFILTIRPGQDVVYPGPCRAGFPATLIGVYIDPGADIQHLVTTGTKILVPDHLISAKLGQDKMVGRLVEQCTGGLRTGRVADLRKKGRTPMTKMYFMVGGDTLTDIHAALCFAFEDTPIHAWHQAGVTPAGQWVNFRWSHLAFENTLRNLNETCPDLRLLLLQVQWLAKQRDEEFRPITLLPKGWLELGPATHVAALAMEVSQ